MNNDYPHPIIAREGWNFLAIAVVAAALLTGWGFRFLAFLAWLAVAFIVQFFRDPARRVPAEPNVVLAPADGRVVKVERVRDPYLTRDALMISVFMNVFNVHSNRSPVDGTVVERWYHAGKFLNAALDKASAENERNALHLRTANGQNVTCVQIAGLIARRILCYVDAGATLKRGQRYGFIRFGSRVDVYIDPAAKPRIAVGDVVFATETILADLPQGTGTD
jgi:phosphatidylserine decarboxylase